MVGKARRIFEVTPGPPVDSSEDIHLSIDIDEHFGQQCDRHPQYFNKSESRAVSPPIPLPLAKSLPDGLQVLSLQNLLEDCAQYVRGGLPLPSKEIAEQARDTDVSFRNLIAQPVNN